MEYSSEVIKAPEIATGRLMGEFCVDSKLGQWLATTGAGSGFHPGLVFGKSQPEGILSAQDMGTSVYADRPIHRHEVLASCSAEAIIDRHTSFAQITTLLRRLDGLKHPDRDEAQQFLTHSLDRTIISLYLILTNLSLKFQSEQGRPYDMPTRGEDQPDIHIELLKELFSFHQEYVRLLPRAEHLLTPFFWTQVELEKLGSSPLLHSVNEQHKLWTTEYESLLNNLPPSLHELITYHTSCQDYFWASTIVTSRSFPSTLLAPPSDPSNPLDHPSQQDLDRALGYQEAVPILLPGVDIFNHKRRSKVEWRSVRTHGQVQRVEIVSLEEHIQRGEQVFNNYGPKSTAELILGYGFALGEEDWQSTDGTKNPDDFYPVKLTRPGPTQIYSGLIGEIFERFVPKDLTHHIRRDGRPPALLLAQLRVSLISSQHDLLLLSQRINPSSLPLSSSSDFLSAFSNSMDSKLSWENELNSHDCLHALIAHKLATFRSSSDDPHSDWSQVRPPVRQMIEIYRQGQLDILTDTLNLVQDSFQKTLAEAAADGFHFDDDDDDDDEDNAEQ